MKLFCDCLISVLANSPHYTVALKRGGEKLVTTTDVRRYLLEPFHPELIGRRIRTKEFFPTGSNWKRAFPSDERRVYRGNVESYSEK